MKNITLLKAKVGILQFPVFPLLLCLHVLIRMLEVI